MKWMKISVRTTSEAVDYISSLFDELGLEGMQIEDNVPISEEDKRAMYIDILPELLPDDGTATVSTYVDEERELEPLLEEISKGLLQIGTFADLGEGALCVEETDDADWIDNWKEFFKPFYAAQGILIKPTWETTEEVGDDTIVIEMDPGTSFGTGAHETTKLCIASLKKHLACGSRILDMGCGSGILSVIALKLGAAESTAVDIDPAAVKAAKENMEANHIPEESYEILQGNILEDEAFCQRVGFGAYDIVAANILAEVIIPLSGRIARHMKPGGLFISSGILRSMKDRVEAAITDSGLEVMECSEMGDWVSFAAGKAGM